MNGKTLILDAFWVSKKPFPTVLNNDSEEGKIFHTYYSGRARYLGWMDLILLKDIIRRHNIKHIIIQNLDALGQIAEKLGIIRVCVSYEYNRFIVNTFSKEKELVHCKPIYANVVFGGWNFSENDTTLPKRVEYYLHFLLKHTLVSSITCMTNTVKFTVYFDDSGQIMLKTEPN